jgi:predicted ATPase
MKLKSISFENYKAFKEKQNLELRPITILIGKNSSGKSVITKLFTLLDNSLSRRINEPLLLNNYGIELGAEFRDLVYGRDVSTPISFSVKYNNDAELFVKVIQPNDKHKIEVLEWKFESSGLSIEHIKNGDDYVNKSGGKSDITTKGFLPNLDKYLENYENFLAEYVKFTELYKKDENIELSEDLKNNLTLYIDILPKLKIIVDNQLHLDYVKPFRVLPKRQYYFSGESAQNEVGTGGEDAYQILIESFLQKSELLEKVSGWYEKNFGWRLQIEKSKSYYEFLLSKEEGNATIKVNLADVGQGMHQALPLVVRANMLINDSIIVLEQPELHLHTAAHADLAELFARSAKEGNQTFVIETHSENVLLRLRKLVIDNDFGFTKDDIIIYWVGNHENGGQKITPITIDEEGTLSNWFDDAFDENLKEILEMDKALNKKQNKI